VVSNVGLVRAKEKQIFTLTGTRITSHHVRTLGSFKQYTKV
jgi:hypothetical protein